jgi:probable FeS assembly SUF system protein SufT
MLMSAKTEELTLPRDCDGLLVPSGDVTTLPAGLRVRITQALGDAFTVLTENGLLVRIDAENADALGREPPRPVAAALDEDGELKDDAIWAQLRSCFDPEIPVNIVELGLIYSVDTKACADGSKEVLVRMTLTAPGCGMGNVLKSDVERKLSRLPRVSKASVEIVLDPPWSAALMSDSARLELGML